MRITVTGRLVNNRVNEGSACTFTANFFDDSSTSSDVWATQIPTNVKYRLDRIYGNPACWSEVTGLTALTPAATVSIPITATQNAILNTYAQDEKRQLTVVANSGLSTQYEQTLLYTVKNLAGT